MGLGRTGETAAIKVKAANPEGPPQICRVHHSPLFEAVSEVADRNSRTYQYLVIVV